MPYFYSEDLTQESINLNLSKEESLHISKTLRIKIGEKIDLLNGKGLRARAQVTDVPKNRGQVSCKVESTELLTKSKPIHLYLAPPRHNILSSLVKQCVELGVSEIHLIDCEYSVAKPKNKDNFTKEIISGAKQSGNPHFPLIHPLQKFEVALNNCYLPIVIGAVPDDKFNAHKKSYDSLSLWIGPEGGFSNSEKLLLKEKGCEGICIGDHILRVETAAIGLLSILLSN